MSIQNIDNKELKRLYQSETAATRPAGKTAARETAGKSAGALSGKDQATLSEEARLLAESLSALKDAPDVRTDLVTQLKEQIDAGNYEIPYDELAKKLVGIVKE